MMTDPIADLLTRIRNASAIRMKQVDIPASKLKVHIAQVLKDEGFVTDYEVVPGEPSSTLRIRLRYGPDGERVIRAIKRISKPGCRVYRKADEIKPVLRGMGVYVLSTPKGVLSDRKAREAHVGGELLCEVY
jgi:small subunit ribosomal protein S8